MVATAFRRLVGARCSGMVVDAAFRRLVRTTRAWWWTPRVQAVGARGSGVVVDAAFRWLARMARA